MNAFMATISRGLVEGHVPFWTSFFVRALLTVLPPNHHIQHPTIIPPNYHILHPPFLLPRQKYQDPRSNGEHYSLLGTVGNGSWCWIFRILIETDGIITFSSSP